MTVERKTWGRPRNRYLAELIYACRTRLRVAGKHNLSQKDVADLAGMHLNTYADIEKGVMRQREAAELNHLANVLQMSDGERQSLFLLALGQDAPPRPGAEPEDPQRYVAFIRNQRWPAFVHDSRYGLVAANDAMARDFPNWKPGISIVEYLLTDPRARVEMIDWAERWAVPLLTVLKTLAAEARDPRLLAQYEELHKRVGYDGEIIVGRHVDIGGLGAWHRADGTVSRFYLHSYRPVIETTSDYTVIVFEPAE